MLNRILRLTSSDLKREWLQKSASVSDNASPFVYSLMLFDISTGRLIKVMRRTIIVAELLLQVFQAPSASLTACQGHSERQSFPQETNDSDPWHVLESELCLSKGAALQKPDSRHLLPEHALVIDEEAPPSLPSR